MGCLGHARHAVRLLGSIPEPLLCRWVLCLSVWGVGVVFGNCIVDASILNACVADCFVVGCVCGNELWFVVIFLFVFVGV